jgi:glycosyltransferase involved in cell wall biosynthesis
MAVILNGVPEPASKLADCERGAVRERWGFGPETVVFGSLVRLTEGKGLDTLLEAFAMLVSRAPRARLFLVGDGPLRNQLERRVDDLGITGSVVFAGFHSEPAPLVQAMDAFVLAVPQGSMSIALLEAMAFGVPPVITFGGPEEAVIDGECGFTAAPNNPGDLARKMCQLAADTELRRRLGVAAAERVAREFSARRVADDYQSIYSISKAPARLSNLAVLAGPKAKS